MIARLVIASLLLAPSASLAQSETGTRIGGRPGQIPDLGTMSERDRARVTLERYAGCVAKRDPMRVAKVLDAPLSGPNNLDKLFQGNFDSCLSSDEHMSQLRMSASLMRGVLYADRVSRTVQRLTPTMVAERPLVVAEDAEASRVATVRFGDCVMRQNPEAALAYVSSHAATEGETKALAALKPSLSACIYSGQKLTLSRDGIKAAVAEAIYRTMRAPVAVKASAN